MMNKLGMGIVISARDLASKTLARLGNNFSALTAKMHSAARRQSAALRSIAIGTSVGLAGRGMLRGLREATDYAGKFEQGLAGVGAVTKATAAEMGQLRNAAIEAGIETQFSPKEAQEGLLNLATAGQTAQESVQTLIPVLDLAAGSLGQLSTEDAAAAVVGTLKSYDKEAKDATAVTDQLLRITQLSNFQARDFAAGLAKAGAAAGVFNQPLEDTLIILGQMRNANIDASSASTAYREATRRLGADQGAQLVAESRGINIFDKKTGKMKEVSQILLEMDEKTRKLSERERQRVVVQSLGARGLLAFNAVAKATYRVMENGTLVTYRGREAIAKMGEAMKSSAGTAKQFKDALLDTYEGQKTLLQGTLQTWAVVVGEPLAKLSKPIVRFVVDVLNRLLRAFNDLSMPVKQIITGVAAFGATLVTIIGTILVVKGVMTLLGLSFGGILLSLGQLVVIAPALALLFGGLGTAAYAAYKAFSKNSSGMAVSWADAARQIGLAWRGVVAIVSGESLADAMGADLDKAENRGVFRFLKGFAVFFTRMKAFWGGLKRGFEAGIAALAESPAMQRLRAALSDVFSLFTGTDAQDSQQMLEQFGMSGERTGQRIAQLGEIALNAVLYLVDLGKRIVGFVSTLTADDVSGAVNGIVEDFRTFWGALKDTVEVLGGIAKGIKVFVNLLQTAAAFVVETISKIVHFYVAAYGAIGKVLSGDFSGALNNLKEWWNTETYTETKAQAGQVIREFDPTSRVGIENEPLPDNLKKIRDRERLRGLSAVRERGQSLLSGGLEEAFRRRAAGQDTTAVEELLRETNAQLKDIAGLTRKPPPNKVQVTLRDDRAADRDRDLDPLFLPGGA